MPPRGSSSTTSSSAQATSRSSAAPYSRRSSSQPKSSRQQFSACGACRMRRVRCDLKDLPLGFVGPTPACSNCKERGIKCVDEFAEVKAVKLLRRGRRLQQVEAIYGKVSDQDDASSSRSCTIPTLHSDFFLSPFWQWFRVQRPILDASEFSARFTAHCQGTHLLSDEGALIAMLLVTWAASFGLDHKGLPETQGGSESSPGNMRRKWKTKCETYVRELLELIDAHGVLRRPSLDGVRALLLLLPLLEDIQPLERLVIYEATMSQVQALCVVSASLTPTYEEALTRARIFWYAYIQEGAYTTIHGGRFYLSNDDLDAFQRTLPSSNHQDIGLPSPPASSSLEHIPNMSPYHHQEISHLTPKEAAAYKSYMRLMYTSSVCLEISNICRKMHGVLPNSKAQRTTKPHGLVDANGMRDIWQGLDRCWKELEGMKRASIDDSRRREIEQFVAGWQIFIFKCHNVVQRTLCSFPSAPDDTQLMFDRTTHSQTSSHSSSSPYLAPKQLLLGADRRCALFLPRIISILYEFTSSSHPGALDLFRWDTDLVRDGCYYAACIAANADGDYIDGEVKRENIDGHLTVDEGFSICASVLASMRWSISKSEEQEKQAAIMWENRKIRRHQSTQNHLSMYDRAADFQPLHNSTSDLHMNNLSLSPSPHLGLMSIIPTDRLGAEDRPMLRPLDLFISSQRRVESAPATACSTGDHGSSGWPSYTPPGTSTSVATGSTGSGYSRNGSPIFANHPPFSSTTKGVVDEIFYQEVDQFNYNPPQLAGPGIMRETPPMVPAYINHHDSPSHTLSGPTYMISSPFNSSMSIISSQSDLHACPSYADSCGYN